MIKYIIGISIIFMMTGCYQDIRDENNTTKNSNPSILEQGDVRQLHIDINGLNYGNILKVTESNDVARTISDGQLTFETISDTYWISIDTQPENQRCSIINGHGYSYNDVNNIHINCTNYDKNGTVGFSNNKKYMTNNQGVISFKYPELLPLEIQYFRDIDEDVTLSGLFFDDVSHDITKTLEVTNDNLISVAFSNISYSIDTVDHFDDGQSFTSIYDVELDNSINNMEIASVFIDSYLKKYYSYSLQNYMTSSVESRTGSSLRVGITSKRIENNRVSFIVFMTLTTDYIYTIDAFNDFLNPERIMNYNQTFNEDTKRAE